jgi:hypothetical protein
MQIQPCDSSELANFPYAEIYPGVYGDPTTGRVLFVEEDDSALLIIHSVVDSEAIGRP